jgi:glycosyltransferase involved in cell wall biosynthesis
MKNITVYTVVYNEEHRIENLLKNCLWSDDIIIYDKSSTDKTREIASKYPCKIIKIPYYNTGSGPVKNIVKDAKNDWLMHVSCSDIIHPKFTKKVLNLINDDSFTNKYDVIAFPYVVGVLGILNKKSPWNFPLKEYLFKKSSVVFSEVVHKEMSFKPKSKIYKMQKNREEAVFHLTHENLDTFFERHIRYTKAEAQVFDSRGKALWKSFGEIFVAIGWMLFYKRVWLLGWKGIALFFAFLSYFFMKFLFVWERFDGKGKEEYDKIKESMLKEWQARKRTNMDGLL